MRQSTVGSRRAVKWQCHFLGLWEILNALLRKKRGYLKGERTKAIWITHMVFSIFNLN